jgi:hypothetical protein
MLRQPRHLITEGRTLLEAIHTMGVRLAKGKEKNCDLQIRVYIEIISLFSLHCFSTCVVL